MIDLDSSEVQIFFFSIFLTSLIQLIINNFKEEMNQILLFIPISIFIFVFLLILSFDLNSIKPLSDIVFQFIHAYYFVRAFLLFSRYLLKSMPYDSEKFKNIIITLTLIFISMFIFINYYQITSSIRHTFSFYFWSFAFVFFSEMVYMIIIFVFIM